MEEKEVSSPPKKKWKRILIIVGILFLAFIIFLLTQTCYIHSLLNIRCSETFKVDDWAFGKAPEKVTIHGVSIPLDEDEAYEIAKQVWSYGSNEKCSGSIIKKIPKMEILMHDNFSYTLEEYCSEEEPNMSLNKCRKLLKNEGVEISIYNERWEIHCDSGMGGMSPSVVSIDEGERRVGISGGM